MRQDESSDFRDASVSPADLVCVLDGGNSEQDQGSLMEQLYQLPKVRGGVVA